MKLTIICNCLILEKQRVKKTAGKFHEIIVRLNVMEDAEYHFLRTGVNQDLQATWLQEQRTVCESVILDNTERWETERRITASDSESSDSENEEPDLRRVSLTHDRPSETAGALESLKYVAGFDISYLKEQDTIACAALVVCRLPDLEVVYEDLEIVNITTPYIAGFLCFRETPPLVDAMTRLREEKPRFLPQVVLIDGNGYLHKRGAGLACYVGVKLDLPTIGVSKNLFHMDNIERDEQHKEQINNLKETGDRFPLRNKTGTVIGMALKTCLQAKKPVYVSVGHRINVDTATWVVQKCSKYRVPEPIRQADIRSRQLLRRKYPGDSVQHAADD